jgi:hypothetical protein
MGIDSFYVDSFTLQKTTSGASFPYDATATSCTAFKGALDQVGSQERWISGELAALTTHWIATNTALDVSQKDVVKYGSRYFRVIGRCDMASLKAGHHQEILLQEVGSDGV